jgi:hypothetical protein
MYGRSQRNLGALFSSQQSGFNSVLIGGVGKDCDMCNVETDIMTWFAYGRMTLYMEE